MVTLLVCACARVCVCARVLWGHSYEDLDALKSMVDAGHLAAHVHNTYSLAHVPAAFNESFAGHVVGKLSIDCSA